MTNRAVGSLNRTRSDRTPLPHSWIRRPQEPLFSGLCPVPLGSDEMDRLRVRFVKEWDSATETAWIAVGENPVPESEDALQRRWREIRDQNGADRDAPPEGIREGLLHGLTVGRAEARAEIVRTLAMMSSRNIPDSFNEGLQQFLDVCRRDINQQAPFDCDSRPEAVAAAEQRRRESELPGFATGFREGLIEGCNEERWDLVETRLLWRKGWFQRFLVLPTHLGETPLDRLIEAAVECLDEADFWRRLDR